MKKILIIVFTFVLVLSYSQSKKVNILIMVDGNPCLTVSNVSIETESMNVIKPQYIVGTVDFIQNDYEKFIDDQSLNFKVNFQTILPQFSTPINYNISLNKNILQQEYVIINIFNI